MQGIYIEFRRPRSKKEVKEAVTADPESVYVEATSVLNSNEYFGSVSRIPEGETIYFVGPDPYTSRKFYGQITRKGEKVTVK